MSKDKRKEFGHKKHTGHKNYFVLYVLYVPSVANQEVKS